MNLRLLATNESFIHLFIVFTVVAIGVIGGVNGCSVDVCSQEYSEVLTVSQERSESMSSRELTQYCNLLNAYQHCLRSISRSCRGNLEFHTLQTLIKNWKSDRNCSQFMGSVPQRPSVVPIHNRRSGQSSHSYNTNHLQQQQNSQQKIIEQKERIQLCLSSAYNYTINTNTSKTIPFSVSDPRTQRVVASDGRTRRKNHRRDSRSAESESSMKTNLFPIRGETIELNEDMSEDIDKNEFNSNPLPSTVPTVRSSTPPSSPLTCIIYGDPHLRTLNNEYQTCRCSGAWPLVEHPLFAVQITNSRVKGANPQLTGVTKVVVLVRQFDKCGIHSDLLYEADSQSSSGGQPSAPAATFVDGSTNTMNNLIRITQSSNNNVITIHLDHIGVRIYISQFESSGYLNAVIKFRSATNTVKQQLVLNSISSNSLCKTGCPKREQIDIQHILKATGVDISANSAQQTDNSVNDYNLDTNVMNNNEDKVDGQEDMPSDPCRDLNGYYRISCLYDVTIKGVKDVNNANRFAQSFDEKKFIHNSLISNTNSVDESEDNSLKIIANSSQKLTFLSFNRCFNVCIVFVISLISRLF